MPEVNSSDQYSTWVSIFQWIYNKVYRWSRYWPLIWLDTITFYLSSLTFSPIISVGLVYIFNLIVGTGALTLPAVFSRAGWAMGLILILVLAFISFITVTFVIETMASANAILTWRRKQQWKNMQVSGESCPSNSDSEDTPLVSALDNNSDRQELESRYYIIDEKLEMGEMASILFSKMGRMLFYLCFTVYLYGDLSIYGAAVAKSMADVACTYQPANLTCNDTIPDVELCWEGSDTTRLNAYRIFLTTFIIVLGPFVFFNVQKTKYLQFLTSVMRWLAFTIMIVYATRKLIINGPQGNPPAITVSGVPGLFGVCVYSFMCHHSLPALVAPIANKSALNRSLALDYVMIAIFYLLLALTGAFAFKHLDDLYTLDFGPRGSGDCSKSDNIFMLLLEYFLALFPVFTLSTSFPIIAITLRNNLQALFLNESTNYNLCIRKLIFPVMAVLPPYLIAMTTTDLSILVGVTGSYAGAGIQYLIPTFLVYSARRKTKAIIGSGVMNKFSSPFSSSYWLGFVVVWSITCMLLVSVHLIEKFQH